MVIKRVKSDQNYNHRAHASNHRYAGLFCNFDLRARMVIGFDDRAVAVVFTVGMIGFFNGNYCAVTCLGHYI